MDKVARVQCVHKVFNKAEDIWHPNWLLVTQLVLNQHLTSHIKTFCNGQMTLA